MAEDSAVLACEARVGGAFKLGDAVAVYFVGGVTGQWDIELFPFWSELAFNGVLEGPRTVTACEGEPCVVDRGQGCVGWSWC